MITTPVSGSLLELDGQLPPGEVHVWLARLDWDEAAMERLRSLLNPEEQERAARFKVAPAEKQFIASHGILRMVLGKYLGIDAAQVKFRSASHGKPELVGDSAVQFNLSHTEGLAAIAVTRVGAVGIDVERMRDEADILVLAERFFSKKEAAWVRAQAGRERTAAFFSCWTAKEAYVKARGGGLSIPLNGFAVIPDGETPDRANDHCVPSELSSRAEPRRSRSERQREVEGPGVSKAGADFETAMKLQLEVFADAAEGKRWSLYQLQLLDEFRGAVAVEGAVSRVRVGWLAVAEL